MGILQALLNVALLLITVYVMVRSSTQVEKQLSYRNQIMKQADDLFQNKKLYLDDYPEAIFKKEIVDTVGLETYIKIVAQTGYIPSPQNCLQSHNRGRAESGDIVNMILAKEPNQEVCNVFQQEIYKNKYGISYSEKTKFCILSILSPKVLMESYKLNVDSLLNQHYSNYKIVFVSDNSSINMKYFLETENIGNKISIVFKNNEKPMGIIWNVKKYSKTECQPTDVVVILNAEDFLIGSHVLEVVNNIYSNRSAWVTSSKALTSNCQILKTTVVQEQTRASQFRPLFTFQASLLNEIKQSSFINPLTKTEFHSCESMILMHPLVELAGPDHYHYIPQILYATNKKEAQFEADHQVCESLLSRSEFREVRQPYAPLVKTLEKKS